MTAKKARANRYSKEDEKIGYRNTFNLLVADYLNNIQSEINHVSTYTDGLVYPLDRLANRRDIVDEIVKNLKDDGYIVNMDESYLEKVDWYTLYISWANN